MLINKQDVVASAGSCFASNLVPYLESAGIKYLRTEKPPSQFVDLGENLGYANFSANYGNVYTSRQLRQIYERATGELEPVEKFWIEGDLYIDPFRPGLKYPAKSHDEFEFITENHLKASKRAFEECSVFVFTLGLTEAWQNKKDGSTYPTCPGTIAGEFDSQKYEFINFNLGQIIEDMSWVIDSLIKVNSNISFILSVSPVPLVATASNSHVLKATTHSKSVLRVAASELERNFKNVSYFPAFEIITGLQAGNKYFEPDLRTVSREGIEVVMNTLLKANGFNSNLGARSDITNEKVNKFRVISKKISELECDEVSLDAQ